MLEAVGYLDKENKILLKRYSKSPFTGPFKEYQQRIDGETITIKALPGYKVEDVKYLTEADTPLGILIEMTKEIALSLRKKTFILEFNDFCIKINPQEDDIEEKIKNYVLKNIKI